MQVQDFLRHSAARLPDKVALVCEGRRLTYAELNALSDRLGAALAALGVKRGDRVAFHLFNSVAAVVTLFAILKAGGVFVAVNRSTKRDKLCQLLRHCRASVLLHEADEEGRAAAQAALESVPSLRAAIVCGGEATAGDARWLAYEPLVNDTGARAPQPGGIDLDLACLIYTSGSTGEPKAVMSDHSNVVFAAGSIATYLGLRESDIIVNVLPLSFDYGLYQVFLTFRTGATLVLERSFAFPAAVLKRIQEERVTILPGVPTLYAMLLRMDLSGFDLSSLRALTNTAAALPASHITELRAKFTGVTLFSMYGLTETKRTLYLPPEQLDRRPGSVGIAIPGTEVWIEDPQGRRLGPGEVGELVVRGRHVMRGYWEAPEATAERYRPGPLPCERVCYTGDLFRRDEEGFLYFVGRKDDIIKSRGEKVAPREVENVLCALPGVVAAAVVGVNDPVLGQAVKAFVVAQDKNLTAAKVLAHCRANLEDYMVPKHVEFRDALPLSPSGKVNKLELQSCAASPAS